jgi:alpha-tubulin suppressor-like RCC1 family protein
MKTKHGSALLMAAVLMAACDDGSPEPIVLESAGAPVAGVVGQQITVAVRARSGNANRSGITVDWTLESGGGSVSAPSTVTDAQGRAQVNWTLGNTAGDQVLVARAQAQQVRFTVAAEADAVATITIVSGDAQTGEVAQEVRDSLIVRVTDRLGNPKGGVTLNVEATAGSPSTSVTFTRPDGRTGVRWRLGSTAGLQRLTFRLDATHSVEFRATGVAGAPVSGVVRTSSTNVIAGDSVTLEFLGRDRFDNEAVMPGATFSSFDTTVAVVTANGALRALTAGQVVIRGQLGQVSALGEITVNPFAYSRISAGANHTCGIGAANRLYCFGGGGQGALGSGDQNDRLVPAEVAGGLTFSRVAASVHFTCAVANDQRTYCWGRNNEAQMGNGSATLNAVLTPSPTQTSGTFVNVSARAGSACAQDSDNRVVCWGGGNLNINETASGIAFTQIAGSPMNGHACGVTADGRAFCWGRNTAGQLGNNTMADSPTPVQVFGPAFSMITVGDEHSCAVSFNGDLYCWGRADLGQLGYMESMDDPHDDCSSLRCRRLPTLVPNTQEFIAVSAFGSSTCGVGFDNQAWCWGRDDGQLGNTVDNDEVCGDLCDPVPTRVETDVRFSAIALGEKHACGLREGANDLYCWGWNEVGQLGRNQRAAAGVIQVEPLPVFGPRR